MYLLIKLMKINLEGDFQADKEIEQIAFIFWE